MTFEPGRRLWTFRSVPRPGEFGSETWENDSWAYTGNTNVWSLMSVDEELGYVYLPFGTPTNDYYGGHRRGNNLFAESLVCLDAANREARVAFPGRASRAVGLRLSGRAGAGRHHRRRPEDRGGGAGQQAGIRLRLRSKDRRAGLADRGTARPADQRCRASRRRRRSRFPTKPPAFDRQGFTDDDVIDFTPELKARALEILKPYVRGPLFTPPSEQGTIQLPGNGGGANWTGAAFDPETSMLYVPSVTNPFLVQLIKPDPARSNLQYRRGNAALPTIDGLRLVKPPYGRLTAYELNTGTIAWQVPLGDGPRNHPLLKHLNLGPLGSGRGSVLLTKTLLFVGLRGGERIGDTPERPMLQALDKATGQDPLERGATGWPRRIADDLSASGPSIRRGRSRRRPRGGARRLRVADEALDRSRN